MFMGLGQSMSMLRTRLLEVVIAAAILVYTVAFGASPAKQQTETGEQLPVPGKSVPADHGKLSEHNMEWLQGQPPQVQAEFLLEAAVNHDRGATDLIANNVDSWRGKVHKSQHLDDLEMTALYSNDLRVRQERGNRNALDRGCRKESREPCVDGMGTGYASESRSSSRSYP
jgi:hypothetical protein